MPCQKNKSFLLHCKIQKDEQQKLQNGRKFIFGKRLLKKIQEKEALKLIVHNPYVSVHSHITTKLASRNKLSESAVNSASAKPHLFAVQKMHSHFNQHLFNSQKSTIHKSITTPDLTESERVFKEAFYESNALKVPTIRNLFTVQNLSKYEKLKETEKLNADVGETQHELCQTSLILNLLDRLIHRLQDEKMKEKEEPQKTHAALQVAPDKPLLQQMTEAELKKNASGKRMDTTRDLQQTKSENSTEYNHSADPYIIIASNGMPISSKEFEKVFLFLQQRGNRN